MKGKKGWKQRACLCLMVFLIGLSGLAGASSRDDIYRERNWISCMPWSKVAAAIFSSVRNGTT